MTAADGGNTGPVSIGKPVRRDKGRDILGLVVTEWYCEPPQSGQVIEVTSDAWVTEADRDVRKIFAWRAAPG
jgi:hypothetical protein